MKLLDDLIASLSGEKPNLTDALMQAKVLLYRLGRKDFAEWVNRELNGYPGGVTVPDYRVLHAMIKGVVTNGYYRYTSHPLPTLHLQDDMRKGFECLEMRESISALEGLADKDQGGLNRPIPVEYNQFFDKVISDGYHVERAWCEIGLGQVGQILTQVRSRLLDFVLELNEKVDDDMTEDDVKKVGQSSETASMFNHAIFGDNATILVGNHSSQVVKNKVVRGDFESLKALFLQNSIPVSDIDALDRAIKGDDGTVDVEEKKFGAGVREWIKAMMEKVIEGSWQIELGIASNLLTEGLKAYYGW